MGIIWSRLTIPKKWMNESINDRWEIICSRLKILKDQSINQSINRWQMGHRLQLFENPKRSINQSMERDEDPVRILWKWNRIDCLLWLIECFELRKTYRAPNVGQFLRVNPADIPSAHFTDSVVGKLSLRGSEGAIDAALGHGNVHFDVLHGPAHGLLQSHRDVHSPAGTRLEMDVMADVDGQGHQIRGANVIGHESEMAVRRDKGQHPLRFPAFDADAWVKADVVENARVHERQLQNPGDNETTKSVGCNWRNALACWRNFYEKNGPAYGEIGDSAQFHHTINVTCEGKNDFEKDFLVRFVPFSRENNRTRSSLRIGPV